MNIQVVRAMALEANSSSTPKNECIGYGRDAEEAATNAGLALNDLPEAAFSEILVEDTPSANDLNSEVAAWTVCRYHIEEDDETPPQVKRIMQQLLHRRLFASGMSYCFRAVWDRDYELDLPIEDRIYLGDTDSEGQLVEWIRFKESIDALLASTEPDSNEGL